MPFAVPRALPLTLLAAFVLAGCADSDEASDSNMSEAAPLARELGDHSTAAELFTKAEQFAEGAAN